jgi:hypothetical protein
MADPADGGSAQARAAFFERASRSTAAVGVSTPTGVFVVAPGEAADLRSGQADAVAQAMEALDALGMGAACRQRWFVELGAVVGTATVAAVRRHGFRRALAIESAGAKPATLRVNTILNDVEDVVDVLPDAPLDAILAERDIDPGEVGLLWIAAGADAVALLAGADSVVRRRRPAVLRGGGALGTSPRKHFGSFVDLARAARDGENIQDRVHPLSALTVTEGVGELLLF